MSQRRQSLIGKWLNCFAMLAFLVLQVPGAAFADSTVGTKVTHEAIKFFVPEKRIRLDAAVTDFKGVAMVRAYFKGKTQADYVFVPMETQQTAKDSYVAILPAMAKSNDEIQYLFLVVNGSNEVLKTEPFVVKAKNSSDVPSWQMVNDDASVKLFTEVPDAPAVAASFSDSVSLNVVESGARFGLVAQLYGASGAATASGAAAGATNAGTASVATAGMSTVTIAAAAAGLVGVAAAGGGSSGSAAPAPVTLGTPSTPVAPVAPVTPSSNANPFAGTWTVTPGPGPCNTNTSLTPPYTIVVSSTGAFLLPPAYGVTQQGSVTTSGSINLTGNFNTSTGTSGSFTESGVLTMTGATAGSGKSVQTITYSSGAPAGSTCSYPMTYSMQ